MNERIKELATEAAKNFTQNFHWEYLQDIDKDIFDKFAELIVAECTNLLFDESERLYAYSSECDNMHESDEVEFAAEKCIDMIAMIEEHFGVEE